MTEHTCAEPPHVLAMRRLEAMLARGERPSLADAALCCPPLEPGEASDTEREQHAWLLVFGEMLAQIGFGPMDERIEHEFAAELNVWRLLKSVRVEAEVMRGK
jgi:hypothetical protein